jgi:multicomponent Na+:H+ antiporter subunit B
MKLVYLLASIAMFIKILIVPNPVLESEEMSIVEMIVDDSGIPNSVSAIIFRNRLFDTIFEVIVFTIAGLGVNFLLSNETPMNTINQFTDETSIVLARFGATLTAIICIELSIRGHLSPGGGFAAGVAGGTAIALIAITSSPQWMQKIYQRYHASTIEKISVIVFIVLSIFPLTGLELSHGNYGELISGGMIPILNIIVALKVALGSWAIVLLFIRYRGLL